MNNFISHSLLSNKLVHFFLACFSSKKCTLLRIIFQTMHSQLCLRNGLYLLSAGLVNAIMTETWQNGNHKPGHIKLPCKLSEI